MFEVGLILTSSHTAIVLSNQDTGIQAQTISIGVALYLVVVGNVRDKTDHNFYPACETTGPMRQKWNRGHSSLCRKIYGGLWY
jgi:hypothetical protein